MTNQTFTMDGYTFSLEQVTYEHPGDPGYFETRFTINGAEVRTVNAYEGCYKRTSYFAFLNGGLRKFYSMKSLTCAISGAESVGPVDPLECSQLFFA